MNRKYTKNDINLTKGYTLVKSKEKLHKNTYSRLPVKLSSQNFLALVILYMVDSSKEGMFGLEIKNKIHESYDRAIWNPSQGTMYPLLKQLTQDGMLESYTVKDSPRKYYKITRLGQKVLESRMEEFKDKIVGSLKFFKKLNHDLYEKNN